MASKQTVTRRVDGKSETTANRRFFDLRESSYTGPVDQDGFKVTSGRVGEILGHEPTAADLAAIEDEWPLIEAELAVLDAEIRLLSAAGGPSPLDWRRLRRAEHRVLFVALRLARCAATGSAARVAGECVLCGGQNGDHASWCGHSQVAVLSSAVAS